MSDIDPDAEATTAILLDSVAKIVGLVRASALPTSAILIFSTVGADGEDFFDYVVTHDLNLTNIIGMAHTVREAALRELLGHDE